MPIWKVTESESGQKLSAFLKDKLGAEYSARQIKQAIEQNACQVNGRIERFATSVVGRGDAIAFDYVQPKSRVKSDILFQDNYLVVSNKPAGISSEDAAAMPLPGLELLHRLDKDTTGVLLWAKKPAAAKLMMEAFKKRLIKKTYFAIVDGAPKQRNGHIENRLGKLHGYQGQSLWGEVDGGLLAITDWAVEKTFRSRASLMICYPLTGRTHQIRVHMSGLGHPILGDKQYGKRFSCAYRPSRCLLHASCVEFMHPITGANVRVEAPLPKDFHEAMQVLEGHENTDR